MVRYCRDYYYSDILKVELPIPARILNTVEKCAHSGFRVCTVQSTQ